MELALIENESSTQTENAKKEPYFLLTNEVMEIMRFESMTSLYRFIDATPDFPKPICLGIRRKAFVNSEIKDWISNRLDNRNV